MTNCKTMNLAKYDKIGNALFFILDVIIDVWLSRSHDYMVLRWYLRVTWSFIIVVYFLSVIRIIQTFRLSDLGPAHIRSDDRGSTTNPNYEQTRNLNKPKSFRVGSARFARSANTTNKIQKIRTNLNFEQTQNSNNPENREPSESRLLRKDNNKPNPKSNQSKARPSGWRNHI